MNGWKIATIILIITNALAFAYISWAWSYGTDYYDNRMKCSVNICEAIGHPVFAYDQYEEICYCYDDEGNEVHQEFIG